MDNYHITPTENGWALTKKGAERASKTALTKAEIIELASEFLDGKTASLKIHNEDGSIQEERTYPRLHRCQNVTCRHHCFDLSFAL